MTKSAITQYAKPKNEADILFIRSKDQSTNFEVFLIIVAKV